MSFNFISLSHTHFLQHIDHHVMVHSMIYFFCPTSGNVLFHGPNHLHQMAPSSIPAKKEKGIIFVSLYMYIALSKVYKYNIEKMPNLLLFCFSLFPQFFCQFTSANPIKMVTLLLY